MYGRLRAHREDFKMEYEHLLNARKEIKAQMRYIDQNLFMGNTELYAKLDSIQLDLKNIMNTNSFELSKQIDDAKNELRKKLELLKVLEENFGDVMALRRKAQDLRNITDDFGVCKFAGTHGNLSTLLAKEFVSTHGVITNSGLHRTLDYPVGGLLEFKPPMVVMWNNPDRLEYIKTSIKCISSLLEMDTYDFVKTGMLGI